MLACPPASATYCQLNAATLGQGRLTSAEIMRLSIGIAHIDDLLADLEQTLATV